MQIVQHEDEELIDLCGDRSCDLREDRSSAGRLRTGIQPVADLLKGVGEGSADGGHDVPDQRERVCILPVEGQPGEGDLPVIAPVDS